MLKANNVVASCETPAQCDVAERYLDLLQQGLDDDRLLFHVAMCNLYETLDRKRDNMEMCNEYDSIYRDDLRADGALD